MKIYFKNLIYDIKVTLKSIRYWGSYTWYDIGTIYLQWRVIRMLSLKYPDGDVTKEPLDEVSENESQQDAEVEAQENSEDNGTSNS